jgi:N-acetylglucosaminyldiphosphoundecaprenol N-acetyl-beta-D-mannosaminyltransferase
MERERILNYTITAGSLDAHIQAIAEEMRDHRGPVFLACANPHSLVTAEKDPEFAQALRDADILLPDGMGIIKASRMLGGSITQRVSGPDVFMGLLKYMQGQGGYSCFFLGSTEETLSAISSRMESEYPDVHLAGVYSPPFADAFSETQNQEMIDAVNAAKPDVLWVGMTAPKQEKWVRQNLDKLDVKLIGCIGAAFDFFAGTKKRSALVFRRLGLEWLPRLFREQRRMASRVLISAPKFFLMVRKQKRAAE